jgi:hypothetical protein
MIADKNEKNFHIREWKIQTNLYIDNLNHSYIIDVRSRELHLAVRQVSLLGCIILLISNFHSNCFPLREHVYLVS